MRRGCSRTEWAVLDWSKLAIDFYEHIGDRRVDAWHLYRLTGQQLQELAALYRDRAIRVANAR